MKLSTKGRYAVSALFDLALNANGNLVSAREISKRQQIPLSYLEQLLLKLKNAALVKVVRGPAGGYTLARKPKQLSIGEIIRAVEGPIALAPCQLKACQREGCCSTRLLWGKLSLKVSKLLDQTNLSDLVKGKK